MKNEPRESPKRCTPSFSLMVDVHLRATAPRAFVHGPDRKRFISAVSLRLVMERAVSDRNILDDFCIRFCAIVDRHVRYIIVSGFLVISAGRRRSTDDIDLII